MFSKKSSLDHGPVGASEDNSAQFTPEAFNCLIGALQQLRLIFGTQSCRRIRALGPEEVMLPSQAPTGPWSRNDFFENMLSDKRNCC